MLTGDNEATAGRIADQLGIDTVIAEVLPGDKAAKIAELQRAGQAGRHGRRRRQRRPALAQADLGIAIGAGTDVAIETADVVLMRSDPLDVPIALRIGRGHVRKMRQNLGWAIGYNAVALPIAAGVFEPPFGLVLRPEIAALCLSPAPPPRPPTRPAPQPPPPPRPGRPRPLRRARPRRAGPAARWWPGPGAGAARGGGGAEP